MNIESILEILKPRPPFWLRVWVFFFLLFNRKEGKRLIETLTGKIDNLEKTYRRAIENNEKADAINAKADRKLKEAEERAAGA
jgi:F0F1-type ATP synthase membrane subunit b/b'